MQNSEQINELATALAKAQGQFKPAKKSKTNPSLHNQYASLDDIIESVRNPLSENELSFAQLLFSKEGVIYLQTMLLHSSGQYLSSTVEVSSTPGNRAVNNLQTLGSGLTYMKRYSLAAMLGVSCDDDDDGNGMSNKLDKEHKSQQVEKATKEQRDKIKNLLVEMYESLTVDDENLNAKIDALLAQRRKNKLDALGKNEATGIIKKLEDYKLEKEKEKTAQQHPQDENDDDEVF